MFRVLDSSPGNVPLSSMSTLSRHRTLEAARRRIKEEGNSLRKLPGSQDYRPELARLIARETPEGLVRIEG